MCFPKTLDPPDFFLRPVMVSEFLEKRKMKMKMNMKMKMKKREERKRLVPFLWHTKHSKGFPQS